MNDFYQIFWYIGIYIILTVYSILDGFDLGIGLLLPFYKDKTQRKAMLDSIFPFWDGNELWLIIGAGILFAVSPLAFSSMLGGFYPGLMIVIFAVTCRAISFEFMYNDEKKRAFLWQKVFIISSIFMMTGGLMSAGNLLQGYPLNENHEFTGGLWLFLRPLTRLTALFGMLMFAMHGTTYTAMKAEGGLKDRTLKKGKIITVLMIPSSLLFVALIFIIIPSSRTKPLFYAGSFIMLSSITLMYFTLERIKSKFSFLLSSACIAGFWLLAGGVNFPNIIKASNDETLSITIYNGSSSVNTLKYLAIFTVVGMAFVTLYTVFIYRIFRKNRPLSGMK
jgi:cytochrome d ubiquinol oxidase subunit II